MEPAKVVRRECPLVKYTLSCYKCVCPIWHLSVSVMYFFFLCVNIYVASFETHENLQDTIPFNGPYIIQVTDLLFIFFSISFNVYSFYIFFMCLVHIYIPRLSIHFYVLRMRIRIFLKFLFFTKVCLLEWPDTGLGTLILFLFIYFFFSFILIQVCLLDFCSCSL